MECDHKFVECGLETKHEFGCIQEYIVCINCGLERDPIITHKRVPFYTKEKPKQNDLTTVKELTDLWLDPDVTSTAYEMYQQVFENKIYRSKMRKAILCACICLAYWKHMGVWKIQHFLNYFDISEKDNKR
jgi:transcription initiation factor TFIIIB Brf1 subunit/transcription initiation factor TFIIB